MAVTTLQRQFRYNGQTLPDPNATLTTDECLDHYANLYPKLLGGKVVEVGVEGDALVYELRERFGDKG